MTTMHAFTGSSTDGSLPLGDLVQASDGNYYGTTEYGGSSNDGTVFRMTPSGATTVMHSFTGTADGSHPSAGLTVGTGSLAGYLLGVTPSGGANNLGNAFEMNLSGSFYELYSFTGGTDGSAPVNDLVQIPGSSTLLGTTSAGGANGDGTLFELFQFIIVLPPHLPLL
jgi:uncharacterized repeat protein (TIGR03803 family)